MIGFPPEGVAGSRLLIGSWGNHNAWPSIVDQCFGDRPATTDVGVPINLNPAIGPRTTQNNLKR
jgi:hypothetical protein